MSERFTACAFTTVIGEEGLPDSIQWMPPGRHSIVPYINGEPKRTVIQVTAELASKFNGQLQNLWAKARAGEGEEPYIDFMHKDEERAADAMELYWGGEDPKNGGIRLRLKWTAAGKEAVLGRTLRKFSPQWDLHKDTGDPIGVDVNLGGLVTRAAFKTIAPVVAKDGGASTNNTTNTMTDAELTKIIGDALKPINDRFGNLEARLPAPAAATAAAAAAPANQNLSADITSAVAKAMEPVTRKLAEIETNSVRAVARAAVEPHITRGAIAPQDNDGIKLWEDMWIANAKAAEAQMAKLPGVRPSRIINTTRNNGTENATGAEPEDRIIAKATEAAGKDKNLNLAEAVIAQARSPQGQADYIEFRKNFAVKSGNSN